MKLWEFVEYENQQNLLVYKHECQDFNTNTKLIVREGQVAIFLHNGQIADVFTPGRYKLSTENLPIISKLFAKLTTGGEITFSSEVFFLSTTNVMSLKWGTSSPMDLQDPNYKIICRVNGCGEASFILKDPEAFFKVYVGTTSSFEKSDLMKFFRSMINMHIKNAVPNAITKERVSILELNSSLLNIANLCKESVNEAIRRTGVEISFFSFENLGPVEDDPSLDRLKEILAKKAEMDLFGYTYQQERSFDVMEESASKGASGITNTIIEAGVGLGIAGAMGSNAKNIVQSMNDAVNQTPSPSVPSNDKKKCPKCMAELPKTAKFCFECGYKFPQKNFCMQCGAELPADAKFCFECGAKQ